VLELVDGLRLVTGRLPVADHLEGMDGSGEFTCCAHAYNSTSQL
jgi:hypothetical protein